MININERWIRDGWGRKKEMKIVRGGVIFVIRIKIFLYEGGIEGK